MTRTDKVTLPENASELVSFSEFNHAYVTLSKDDDGVIYLASWFYGTPNVLCAIYPDGRVFKEWDY